MYVSRPVVYESTDTLRAYGFSGLEATLYTVEQTVTRGNECVCVKTGS